jgi:SAM-dependent methyltransferase
MADPGEFFTSLALGYRRAKTLMAANELGLFAALEGRGLGASELADRIDCDPRATQTICDALVVMGLLVERDGLYENGALAAAHLVPGRPGFVGHNLRFQNMLCEAWTELESVVRSGSPRRTLAERISEQGSEFAAEYIRGMQPISRGPARWIAKALEPLDLRTMIDVGCGPGEYALAFVEGTDGRRATLLDLPEALETTRALTRGGNFGSRLTYRAADYRVDEFGEGFDVAMLSHVTHDESPEVVAGMFRRAHRALNPGGYIAIHDWVMGPAAARPEWSALFAVHVLTYTDGGRVYSSEDYSRLLADAGFVDVRSSTVLPESANPTTLILARRG